MKIRHANFGLVAVGTACLAAWTLGNTQASADDVPLKVTPAVYRTNGSEAAAQVQLAHYRHGGYYHGYGYGGPGYHRGYWNGGYYRPYYGPGFGVTIAPNFGNGYGAGYGYYGYPGYGYRGGYGRCW
jgi:hypothetical protein